MSNYDFNLNMDDIELQMEMEALEQEAQIWGWSEYNRRYYQVIKDELDRIQREWNEYIRQTTK
jgi:hypothetical protein